MKEDKNKRTVMLIIDKKLWYEFNRKYPYSAYKRIRDFIRNSVKK